MNAMLKVDGINTYYGHSHVLKNVSMQVPEGSLISIIGANGAGKSTLLKAIIGLLMIESGHIHYNSADISRLPAHAIVKHGIGLVPEGRQLFGPLSVLDNLMLGTYKDSRATRNNHLRKSLEGVFNLFPILKNRSRQKAGTLSGGEQQMLAIARALMSKPQLLLLDEPSLGLAPLVVQEIMRTLVKLKKRGITLVLVEQNARLALAISDYTYVIDTGRMSIEGPSCDLLNDEKIKNAYLGQKS
jgi:branched-chain amino acid transport system ATP-binding protein